MKTEQIMTREFYGSELRQNHKTGFFNITDLVKIGNKYRDIQGSNKKAIADYLKLDSTKEFIKKIAEKEKVVDVVHSKKGKYGGTWAHPLIMIDVAMWINSDFKYEALKYLEDRLIENRDNSGDSYKKMSSVLYEKFEYNKIHFLIREIAKRIKDVLKVEDWNKATSDQLKDRDKIHNNIIYGCKLGTDLKTIVRTAIEDIYPNYLKGL
jgi:hypothetical protein